MFEYFDKNFTWSFARVRAIDTAGSISEVDEACRSLREKAKTNDQASQEAWLESWNKLGDRVYNMAKENEEAGQLLSAGRKYRPIIHEKSTKGSYEA